MRFWNKMLPLALVLASFATPLSASWAQSGGAPQRAVGGGARAEREVIVDPGSGKPLRGDVAELRQAIDDGWAITPKQSAEALKQFLGDPNATATVTGAFDDASAIRFGFHYTVDINEGPNRGNYIVRVADGAVAFMVMPTAPVGRGAPEVVDVPTAQATAVQFAQAHYPGFDPARCSLNTIPDSDVDTEFLWYERLGPAGALATWPLSVSVNMYTGLVSSYCRPMDRPPNCRLVPRISAAQAIQAALPFARTDPAQVPFNATLQVDSDGLGVDELIWVVLQGEIPNGIEVKVLVDAMTGEVLGVGLPLGEGGLTPAGRKAYTQISQKRPSAGIHVRSGDGKEVASVCPPEMHKGSIWVRAEYLSAFKARVRTTPERLEIRVRKQLVTGKQIGAEYRGCCWWVPIRAAADAFGWPVTWLPEKKELVVRPSNSLPVPQLR